MNNFIFTDGERYIRIVSVPNHSYSSDLFWHMNASGQVWKCVPGGDADISIHWNRIASVVTGWCPPSFADFMAEHEGGIVENQTTPPDVFLDRIEEAIEEVIR